jgi:hypothetical protein
MHMLTIAHLLLAAVPLTFTGAQDSPCDFSRRGNHTQINGTRIDTDDHGESTPMLTYSQSDGSRCVSATIVGRLRYAENDDDVLEIPFGGYAAFRERTDGSDRELVITRGENGGTQRQYRRNGQSSAYDDDARRWLAGFLPPILMNAGINVGPRVARWQAQGGTENVLRNIGTMQSSGAKRSHYEVLMSSERLSDADLDRVVQHAGRNLPSSGDLRAVLLRAAPMQRGGVRSGSALEDAITHMASSGDKTAVLEVYGETTDRGMLMSVMRMARTIQSSGDKARLLRRLAPRYLTGTDRDLQDAFYQVAQTIPSSGDLSNVLMISIPFAAKSPGQTMSLLDAARSIASSGDRSNVLVALVRSGAVQGKEVRDRFFDVAESVPSSGDRSRVLTAAARYPER